MQKKAGKRRGRLLLALGAMIFLAWLWPDGGQAAQGDSSTPLVVEVQAGDTLWGIAHRYGQPGDIREAVDKIKRWNSLRRSEIYPGQQLIVYIK